MNQTWENGKKSNLGPNFDTFGLNLDLKNFFVGFIHLHEMLEIVTSYRCIQFQGKLINQTCENGKKPSFRPHLAQIRTNNFFFSKTWLHQSLDIMVNHQVQYQKKLMIQSWKNLVMDGRTDRWTTVIS